VKNIDKNQIVLSIMEDQRNQAMNALVSVAVELEVAKQELITLKKELVEQGKNHNKS